MSDLQLPLILEADELEKHLGAENLVIVDLCKGETYLQSHIPGAIHLQYPKILHVEKPVMGLVPNENELSQVLTSLGITSNSHVVAYDDEGGGKACRFLWTLDIIGHQHYSLLNGGLHAWANEGHPLDNQPVTATSGDYQAYVSGKGIATKDDILKKLDDPNVVLLDNRSMQEYTGTKRFAERGGHIPHAVNLDWMLTMDQSRNLRLLPDEQLKNMLDELGVTPEKEIILYCQTHHRSSHTYMLLKHLGYNNIKGYPGAWSEWGNLPDTPIES